MKPYLNKNHLCIMACYRPEGINETEWTLLSDEQRSSKYDMYEERIKTDMVYRYGATSADHIVVLHLTTGDIIRAVGCLEDFDKLLM